MDVGTNGANACVQEGPVNKHTRHKDLEPNIADAVSGSELYRHNMANYESCN